MIMDQIGLADTSFSFSEGALEMREFDAELATGVNYDGDVECVEHP